MPFKETLLLAFASLGANKLRSGLTMLGITIGVFSVISVMTATGALQGSIESGLSFLGSNIFQFAKYPAIGTGGPQARLKYANRHTGGMNCSFFDGHAKWLKPDAILASRNLTGCSLVHKYPTLKMCDKWNTGCTTLDPKNICNDERFNPANFPND